MRRLPALVAALLLPVAQSLILGTAVTTGSLLIYPATAQAQSAEAVAKVAQAITVRIEGATQGSGVLVKRDGNRYTVLTAWHVVSGQRPGEELSIFTPDGQEHPVKAAQSMRQRRTAGECLAWDQDTGRCASQTGAALQDATAITFYSSRNYSIAAVMDYKEGAYCVTSADKCDIYVAGFPASASRTLAVTAGRLIAYGKIKNNSGYSLVYSAPTRIGMSGGPVLDYEGFLMGIHARGDVKAGSPQNLQHSNIAEINQGVALPCDIDFNTKAYAVRGTRFHGYRIKSCD
jgi:V8-like Glu-specific endopeptidase